MKGNTSPLPKWLVVAIVGAAVLTDLCTLLAGLVFLSFTPQSIRATTDTPLVATIWASMLVVGSLAALTGSLLFRVRVQVFGLCLSAGGMFVWAIAAVTQPAATTSSFGVGCAFAALFYALGWRVLGLFAGIFIRRGF